MNFNACGNIYCEMTTAGTCYKCGINVPNASVQNVLKGSEPTERAPEAMPAAWETDLWHDGEPVYRASHVRRLVAAAQPVAEGWPADLCSEMLPPDGGPRFRVRDDGNIIDDEDFIFDARLTINGDFVRGMRAKYAQAIADALNAAAPQPTAGEQK